MQTETTVPKYVMSPTAADGVGMASAVADLDKEIHNTQALLADVHGSECEVYARIVGYYRSVKNWNKGKKEEYGMRSMFDESMIVAKVSDGERTKTARGTAVGSSAIRSKDNEAVMSPGYEMFVRATCPNCPPVKDYMAKIKMQGVQIDVDTDAGLHEATSRGVFSAPTVIFFDANGNERARAHTTEELDEIIHAA